MEQVSKYFSLTVNINVIRKYLQIYKCKPYGKEVSDTAGLSNWWPAGRIHHAQATPIPARQRRKTSQYVTVWPVMQGVLQSCDRVINGA